MGPVPCDATPLPGIFIVRDQHPGERLFKNNDLLLDGTTDPPNHLNPDEEWYTTRFYTDMVPPTQPDEDGGFPVCAVPEFTTNV